MSGMIDPYRVKLLNFVLKHSDAQFVVSSAWRYFVYNEKMSEEGLSWLFRSHGILNRMVGITRSDRMISGSLIKNERGQQIQDWLNINNHIATYAVVDDLDLGIRESEHPFVQTDGAKGISPVNVVDLIKLLGIKEETI